MDSDTPGSKWGRLNSGQHYSITALDLDRAIACAEFTKYEAPVFQHAREKCWFSQTRTKRGRERWPEPRPAIISPSVLAKLTGLPRNRIAEGKSSLIASRILITRPNDTFIINKEVEEWIFPTTGEPRFTPALLRYFAQTWPLSQASLDLQTDPERIDERLKGVRQSGQGVSANPDSSVRQSGQGVSANPDSDVRQSGHSPIEERARVLDFNSEELRGGGEGNPPQFPSSVREENEHERLAREYRAMKATMTRKA